MSPIRTTRDFFEEPPTGGQRLHVASGNVVADMLGSRAPCADEEEIPVNHEILFQEVETAYAYPVFGVDDIV
ncbi:hypothetical protein [Mycobacterium simulans]|uniref:hypothetical protein n=1 Tax=Mycobacterium simulans TaxID=627089 RepID=UPI00163F8C1C|nr:hypothetical protein [Mycobacterium simulans]